MNTEKREVQIGQKILLSDGTVDFVDDFDGSFYFLRDSDESFLPYTMVNVVVD